MDRQPRSETALVAELAAVMACSASPVGAVLELALSCAGPGTLVGAAVFEPNVDARTWSVLATTDEVDAAQLPALAAELPGILDGDRLAGDGLAARGSAWHSPEPIEQGHSSVIRLYEAGQLVGALSCWVVPRRDGPPRRRFSRPT